MVFWLQNWRGEECESRKCVSTTREQNALGFHNALYTHFLCQNYNVTKYRLHSYLDLTEKNPYIN